MLSKRVDDVVGHADAACCRWETRKINGTLPATGVASLESGSEPVLVQQPAETVNTLDDVPTFEPAKGQVWDRLFEIDAAVRALPVVVGDELPQDALGMAFTADEHPIQALRPGCEHEPFGERVRAGRSKGCLDDAGTYRSHHLVKWPNELTVAVADQEPELPGPGPPRWRPGSGLAG